MLKPITIIQIKKLSLAFSIVLATSALTMAKPIDSVATVFVKGSPVIFYNDTLFFVFSKLGSNIPSERANTIKQRLYTLVDDTSFMPDSLYVSDNESTSEVLWNDRVIFSITDGDAAAQNASRMEVAKKHLQIVKTAIKHELELESTKSILTHVALTVLEILAIYLLLLFIGKAYSFLNRWLVSGLAKHFKSIKIGNYEFLNDKRLLKVALGILYILRWVSIILVIYLALPILFSIFPWTRGWAELLFGYILNPLKLMVFSIIGYIPNLFTIIIIFLFFHFVIRGLRFLVEELKQGNLVISEFHPDWAQPTLNILKVFLYAFMFILIFPYLPGSDSNIFQGVSVFLGIVLSFGSSSAIANAVSGIVITYMRPFKIGDRIKIGEVIGDVIEKSLLVTRIRTIKNEEITIPNSSVLTGHTINYSTAAETMGLILHTAITIGYDAPWRTVHELLIQAALATDYIIPEGDQKPFVLQTSLDDFYVSYQLNAFTKYSHKMDLIYSQLHQNIQDKFNEGGIEIMSPHYSSLRNGNTTTIPPDYLDKKYKAPSFKISVEQKNKTNT